MSPDSLLESARAIAANAPTPVPVEFDGWDGSMRSVSADKVPLNFIASTDSTASGNFHYRPRTRSWQRRLGQSIKFDTITSNHETTGLLPALWASSPTSSSNPSKCRQLEEFISSSVSDSIPTLAALVTRETVASGLDDGRFSTLYLRDQVNSLNYTLGMEYNSSSYPAPGTTAAYKVTPLWHESGDGQLTRGIEEYQRRLFFNGSRRMEKVGNWRYFPNRYGTPVRWNDGFTQPSSLQSLPISDAAADTFTWQQIGAATWYQCINTSDDATSYASRTEANGTWQFHVNMGGTIPTSANGVTVSYRARRTGTLAVDTTIKVVFVGTDGIEWSSGTITPQSAWTTSFADYTLTCTSSGATGQVSGRLGFVAVCQSSGGLRMDVTYAYIGGSSTTYNAIRLIPSGPLPPCHAGTLSKGTAIAGSSGSTFLYPTSDVTLGSWTNQAGVASLFDAIDETHDTANDGDYIKTPLATNTTCEVHLTDPGFAPSSSDTVKVVFRYAGTQTCTLTVSLIAASTVVTSQAINIGSAPPILYSSFTLSAANITTVTGITSDWSDVRLRFATTNGAFIGFAKVTQAYVQITSSGQTSEGAWHGKDRFAYSVAYRFEDDSIWMPCIPRLPNSTLANGFNLFTVDSANTDTAYDKVTWNNIPVPPFSVKSKLLLRTPKIDSTTSDALAINVFDLRVTAEVAAAVTSYDDYAPDDDELALDVDELLIRFDHIMPPRARYIFAGDSRICHSYGGQNPCAIILAPVSISSDTTYDLNVSDTATAAFSTTAFYYQLSSTSLILSKDVAGTVTSTTFSLSTYAKIQDLVDAINATTTSSNCGLWRCQIAPGADPAAPTQTALCPTTRAIASMATTFGSPLVTAASGLSVVGVGSYVSGTGITAGTYVVRIDSDLQLRLSQNATATSGGGGVTLTFTSGTGDTLTGDTNQYLGRVRVIANSLPGFIYFNATYLNTQAFDKSAVWMTVGTPGSNKSAPNCFSGKITNIFRPPLEAGISMGGRAVDNGFIVPFSKKRAKIVNTRDSGTGLDQDYRLLITNEHSGCCAWQSLAAGTGFAVMFAPEGWVAQSLEGETALSEAIWKHPVSDADTGVGDFSYEAPQSIASTASDTDNAYMIGRIINNALWVHYRTSGSTAHPDRQVVYDFSTGTDNAGLRTLVRPNGQPWGWSVPMSTAVSGQKWYTALCQGRRSDGNHLYAWNEQNQGATGDGRIDELETGQTDNNSTAISALIATPWIRFGDNYLAGQQLITEHSTPTGATAQERYVRSTAIDAYTFTPSTSSTLAFSRDIKELTLPARTPAQACYITWAQTAGTAREIRKAALYALRLAIRGRGPSNA